MEALRQRGQRRWLVLASASEMAAPQPRSDSCVSEVGTFKAAFVGSWSPPSPKTCARLPVHPTCVGEDADNEAEEAALADVEERIQGTVATLWMNHHTAQTAALPGCA